MSLIRQVRRGATLAALLAGALVTGCAKIPVESFNGYRAAFAEADGATKEVLADYQIVLAYHAQTVARQKQAVAAAGPDTPRLPAVFDPSRARAQEATIDVGMAVRLKALAVIARYNDVLLGIAEGKRQEQLRQSMSALGGAIETLPKSVLKSVPIAGQVVDIAGTLFDIAQKGKDAEDFKRGIKAGRPLVQAVIGFMVDEAAAYSEAYLAMTGQRLEIMQSQASSLKRKVFRMTATMSAPTDAAVIRAQSDTFDRFNALTSSLYEMAYEKKEPAGARLKLVPVAPAAGVQVYDALVQSQVEQFYAEASDIEARALQAVADAAAVDRALVNYVRLWDAVSQALERLEANLDSPRDIGAIVDDVTRYAVILKGQMKAVRAARP